MPRRLLQAILAMLALTLFATVTIAQSSLPTSTVVAYGNNPTQLAFAGAVPAAPFPEAGAASEAIPPESSSESASPQQPNPAAKKPKNPPERPTIDSSMVGYIENAIVGSEVRVRVDAAFNNDRPDRAEFIYGKCGCFRTAPGSANDPNAPGPGPGTPTGVPKDVNFQVLSFMGEYAPKGNRRFSGFIQIPFRWLQPEGVTPGFPNGAGISDIEVGLKFALLASANRYLTAQLKTYFPSGSALHGLGTNHYSLEPALLYYQRFSRGWEVEGELGGWLPIGGSAGVPTTSSSGVQTTSPSGFAGNIFFYGIGPSYRVVDHEQFKFAPVIELVGWSVTGGQRTGTGTPPFSASGTNIVNLKIGGRMSFHVRDSIYVGYGVALTSADWYNDIVRVEYRHTF